MPISKKPRSKTAPKTSTKTNTAAALPDRRAMETSWRRSLDAAVMMPRRKRRM